MEKFLPGRWASAAMLIAFLLCSKQQVLSQSLGQWSMKSPMPTARKEIANATGAVNGRIYTVAGVASNGTISNRLEIYDAATDTWSTGASLPIAVWRASAAFSNGRLYVFGGYQSLDPFPFNPTNRVFEYDPATNQWTEKAAMPTARGSSAAVEAGGLIHVLGGASSSALNLHQVYNPVSNSWSTAAPIPTPRSGLTADLLDGKIYAAGGYILSGGVVPQTAFEAYDVAAGTWQSRQGLPLARLGIDAAVLRGKFYVFGGATSAAVSSRTLEYDPGTNSWRQLQNMPDVVSFMGVATVGDTIYAIGGGPVNLNRFDAVNFNRAFLPPGVITGIGPEDGLPETFHLNQNFPNPFNPSTTIRYQLPVAAQVTVALYNARGQRIRMLVNGRQPAGEHSVVWDGRDAQNQLVSSGIYVYTLQAENRRLSRKLILLR